MTYSAESLESTGEVEVDHSIGDGFTTSRGHQPARLEESAPITEHQLMLFQAPDSQPRGSGGGCQELPV